LLGDTTLFKNAGASLITTRRGALCVMPAMDEIEKFVIE
jgi:hypothetical protein